MFADRLAIAQVVILPDHGVEKFLLGRPAHLAQLDGGKFRQGGRDRSWLKIESRRNCSSSQGIIVVVEDSGRKSYQLVPFKMEQKPPADAILELAVGLAPVPGLAEPARNGATTFASILVNDLEDEGKIALGDISFTVGEKNVHENERNRIFS